MRWEKPWILALFILLINFVFGFIVMGLEKLLGKEYNFIYFLGGILGAILVGRFYVIKIKKKMDKKIRKKTSFIYYLITTLLGFIYFWSIEAQPYSFFVGILIVLGVPYSLLIYYLLGKSSEISLKNK